uniref:Uncharacterized protein n=1 Tax=Panagrolaimus sp. PS1159 TaxID=55785 RepID=A0AC35G3M4_9BILA
MIIERNDDAEDDEPIAELYETFDIIESDYQLYKNIAFGISNIELNFNQKDLSDKINLSIKLSVLKYMRLVQLLPNEISHVFSFINLSNLEKLEIVDSNMSFEDLMQIQNLKNVKFILLDLNDDGTETMEKITEILEATINIPELEFCYADGIIKEEDNFEVFLVEWVLKNGYFKSFLCHTYYEEYGCEIQFSS